uniref:Uncharacterized protein n=1 Tax=uncultured prokaryote TaxID=198431 RepID=A0A0H5QMA4_9ZZZZ|nr:hypothetical protein [uncultured prokaryote]
MAQTDQLTRGAIATLADLARGDSGGSFGARSLLIYAFDTSSPIHDFASLSGQHRDAAIIILDRDWAIDSDVIESIVPEIRRWHSESKAG